MTLKQVDQLPQAFNASSLCIPREINLDGDWLTWRWLELPLAEGAIGRNASPKGLLDKFVRLKKPEDVEEFARAYGPLGICKHGHLICHADEPAGGVSYIQEFPTSYADDTPRTVSCEPSESAGIEVVSAPTPEAFYCPPARLSDGRLGERVDWWIRLAAAMRACLKISNSLQKARRPRAKDQIVVYDTIIHGLSPLPVIKKYLPEAGMVREAGQLARDGLQLSKVTGARADGFRSQAWRLVLDLINQWLTACPVRLHFTYTDSRPVDFSMSFIAGDQRGCFPALVFQLIGRVRAAKGNWMVNCANCNVLVSPRSELRHGKRVFCEACRADGWPMRLANRDHYADKKTEILASRKRKRRESKGVGDGT